MLTKSLPIKAIVQFSIIPILIGGAWSLLVVLGFVYLNLKWLAIPFLPISLLGIAVSFYVGPKILKDLVEILTGGKLAISQYKLTAPELAIFLPNKVLGALINTSNRFTLARLSSLIAPIN